MSTAFAFTVHGALDEQTVSTGSNLLARAFFPDPLFSRVQPEESRRRAGLPPLFAALLRDAARRGGVLIGADAALAWMAAHAVHANLIQQILRGYAAVPLRLGLRATSRLQSHEDWGTRRMLAHAPADAAYVYCVGVEPELAGRGTGSKLMNTALARIGQDHPVCVLRTEQPKNVRFYEKLGFRCVEHATAPATGLPTWFFVRQREQPAHRDVS